MQVTMKASTGYPSQPFVTRDIFAAVCPETTIIVLDKCTKHRIKNPLKLHHLNLMRHNLNLGREFMAGSTVVTVEIRLAQHHGTIALALLDQPSWATLRLAL
jgi:hypothetical protein